jgi:cell division protein FtsL
MFKKIQERVFPFIIALSALSVSASAAFYSVSGLSKLFAGASLEVIIMASSLEVAKLVIASLLYQYRKELSRFLKVYLSIALVVLVLITSMGIYGFLSAAYQETANKAGNLDAQISLLETKRDNFEEQLLGYSQEKESLNQSISELRAGLAGNKIQYKDKETGEIITTTSSSNRRAFERQLDQALERQDVLNEKIDDVNESIFNLETEIVEVKTGNDLAGELGPLKYLSDLTGIGMDSIINYLLLIIIFVFDPLAISLVVAANFAFAQLKPKVRENIYGEKFVDGDLFEEGEDWKEETVHLNTEEILNSEEEEDWKVVDDEFDLDGDGIISEDEKNILRILEETGRQYKVLYKDGTIRWVDKPEEKNRKVY